MDPGAAADRSAPAPPAVADPADTDARSSSVDAAESVVSRSLAGTRWVLWMSAAAVAFGFGTNVVLARSGPGLLGFYGFLTLTLSLLGIFFVVGGGNVVVNYLPKLAPEDKTSFLTSYAGVVVVSSAALLGLAAAVPALPDLIYGEAAQTGAVGYLALLLPIAVVQMLAWSTLQADLALRTFAVSQGLVASVTFGSLLIAGFAGWLDDDGARRYVLGAVLLANVVSIAVAVTRLWRNQLRKWGGARRAFLPEGFWRFSLYFHAGVMVSFAVRSLDQVYVMRELGLVSLGYYRSALVLAQLANFLLVVTDKGFYSTFCNVDPDAHPKLYRKFVRLNSVGASVVGLVLLLFAGELLKLFGESATADSRAVVTLLAAAILAAFPITSVNNSLVTARERMRLIFVNNAVGALGAVLLYAWLGDRLGLIGVGWAFLGLQMLMLLLSSLAARRAAAVGFPAGAWVVSLVAVAVGAGLGSVLDGSSPSELLLKGVAAVAFVPLLLLVRLVTVDELKDLVALVVPGRWFRRAGAPA